MKLKTLKETRDDEIKQKNKKHSFMSFCDIHSFTGVKTGLLK